MLTPYRASPISEFVFTLCRVPVRRRPTPATAMRTSLLGLALFACLPSLTHAQSVFLTGIGQTGASSTGSTAGSPIWNTLGGDTFANLYIDTPNAGPNAVFLNHGDSSGASVNYALTPGSYTFYFSTDGFANNDPGFYGLNLFFGGDNTHPGISVFAPTAVLEQTAVPAGLPVISLDGSGTTVPSPGVLTYTANGLSITFTQYSYDPAGAFGGPPLDRVSNLNDVPDGVDDGVGVFYLTVTAVPEPAWSAVIAGLAGLFLIWRRK